MALSSGQPFRASAKESLHSFADGLKCWQTVTDENERTTMTMLKKALRRIGNKPLSSSFLRDRSRRLVVSLIPGNGADVDDVVTVRPERSRSEEALVQFNLADLYRMGLWNRANGRQLAKARERKARIAQRRESRKLAAAERRLTKD